MKRIVFTLIIIFTGYPVWSQVVGHVYRKDDNAPLAGVSIYSMADPLKQNRTDYKGNFKITISRIPDTLVVEAYGYINQKIVVRDKDEIVNCYLEFQIKEIDEVVVNTGYQELLKERATGSFDYLDSKTLERGISTDIISRLEGMTSGMQFLRSPTQDGPTTKPDIRVRGLSTILGQTNPLIVLDNFPYEGSLSDVNPNDIESVSVLKDASAAAIWGAQAGNGVIVITSKKVGSSDMPKIGFRMNWTSSQRPNLNYDRRFLTSNDFIELEKMLFNRGLYQKNNWTALSPAVELLFAQQDGLIDDEATNSGLVALAQYDIRDQSLKYLYRPLSYAQYALNIRGSGPRNKYYLSFGFDNNKELQIGDQNRRLTTLLRNELTLLPDLKLSSIFNFVHSKATNNGIGLLDLAASGSAGNPYVYMRLADDDGQPLSVVRDNRKTYTDSALQNNLLDWDYRPLEEIDLADNTSQRQEVRFNTALTYRVNNFIDLEARYQIQKTGTLGRNLYTSDSYYARNMINRFTQPNGTRPVPLGGIMDESALYSTSNSGRIQLHVNNTFSNKHSIDGILGLEIREELLENKGNKRLYGYNDELLTYVNNLDFSKSYSLLPNQSGRIENGNTGGSYLIDRFVSYYSNVQYSYLNKYQLNTSIRWDASNIFGVDFNQKGLPLWSVGVGWNALQEKFLTNSNSYLSRLRLRASYGLNGNSFRSLSALPIIKYSPLNSITRQVQGNLSSLGNPDLSWEKIETINVGLQLAGKANSWNINLDLYQKNSSNLIGEDLLDPTKGFYGTTGAGFNIDNRRNYADMTTKGIDLELNLIPWKKTVSWRSTFLFSAVHNTITNYFTKKNLPILNFLSASPPPVEGNSRDQLYAIPWVGLDQMGNPMVKTDQGNSIDYNSYFNGLAYNELKKIGLSTAPYYGSWRNIITYKHLTVDANIIWKAGHVFKRSTIEYSNLFGATKMANIDYLDRWQEVGDEMSTSIPSIPTSLNSFRDAAYTNSEIVYENGSYLRLQDISLIYTVESKIMKRVNMHDFKIHLYCKNLGLLWKATSYNIDPDVFALYPQPRQLSIGISFNL